MTQELLFVDVGEGDTLDRHFELDQDELGRVFVHEGFGVVQSFRDGFQANVRVLKGHSVEIVNIAS